MKPAPFAYHDPESLAEAVSLLADLGDEAVVLAGGQSLVPMLALRLAMPGHVIDINRISALGFIEGDDGLIRIGALARQHQVSVSPTIQDACPLLTEALRLVAHREIRSRGTVVGSLAHADPAAELPAVMRVLGADLVLASSRGTRVVPGNEFAIAPLSTAREPDELVTEVRFPAPPPGSGWCFRERSLRHHDFPLMGVGVLCTLTSDGSIEEARIGFCGGGPVPLRAPEAEAVLRGERPSDDLILHAAHRAALELDPPSDVLAPASYRRQLAQVLSDDALRCALLRAAPNRP